MSQQLTPPRQTALRNVASGSIFWVAATRPNQVGVFVRLEGDTEISVQQVHYSWLRRLGYITFAEKTLSGFSVAPSPLGHSVLK